MNNRDLLLTYWHVTRICISDTNGFFNIEEGLLNIENTKLIRYIYNSEGKEEYNVEIISDFTKWYKSDNTLIFKSNEKQVETTIKILLTE